MRIEKNIKRIEALAAEREDTNWEFRSFLKSCDMSPEELDNIVHKFTGEVTDQIDCTQCANCCKQVRVLLKSGDIERLVIHLGTSHDAFVEEFLVESDENDGFEFRSAPCPLLKDNLCTVYPSRPDECRSYPHLHKEDFVFRLIQVCFNCSVCPIVFNVYELLKQNLWTDSRRH